MAPASKNIGSIRRSQVITTYGPGAIVDFRSQEGAALSGVLAGLESWDESAGKTQKGLSHFQTIHEPRLQLRLRVKGFRLPPIKMEDPRNHGVYENATDVLPVVRFPEWLQCPECNRLKRAVDWGKIDISNPMRYCDHCSKANSSEKVHVVPVRFIAACEKGHLSEFPWTAWIGCTCEKPRLKLETKGPGLAGKILSCDKAGCSSKRASLDSIFRQQSLRDLGDTHWMCKGTEPWLPDGNQWKKCGEPLRVLQRGASNVYWSDTRSSLDIPPFSQHLSEVIGRQWPVFEYHNPDKWEEVVDNLIAKGEIKEPAETVLAWLNAYQTAQEATREDSPLIVGEFLQFLKSRQGPVVTDNFQVTREDPPKLLRDYLSDIVLAPRLREVRALVGFTRINPPAGDFSLPKPEFGRITSEEHPEWLPAIENKGEGIFLQLQLDRVKEWEQRSAVKNRVEELRANIEKDQDFQGDINQVTPRRLLLHSLAHALILRLSLDCGYSSSALRERLYVDESQEGMAGLLIHTGSPDSEGTLGGLVRQGKKSRIEDTFISAIKEMAWCSSDPVCIHGTATLSTPMNGAACHACLLVPETCCQHFNQLLDRALLVGTPECRELGYFPPAFYGA